MKTSKMFLGILGFILTTSLAQADSTDITTDLSINCVGTEGSFISEVISGVLHYQLIWQGQSYIGLMPHPASYELSNVAPDPNLNWLNITASITKPVWVPPHQACAPTRVPNSCMEETVEGQYENVADQWFDTTVDYNKSGVVSFAQLDVNLPGLKTTLKSLGQDTHCYIQGVQLAP